MNWKGYASSCRIQFIDTVSSPQIIVVSAAYMVMFFFVLTQVWSTIYTQGSSLEGLSLAAIIWYLCIAEATTVASPNPQNDIQEEVVSGGIAYELSKPYDYLMLKFVKDTTRMLMKLVVVLSVGLFIGWLQVGLPEVTLSWVWLTLLSVLLANTIAFFGKSCVGLCALWVENVDALTMVYVTLELVVGGIFFPLDVLPPALSSLAKMSPFAASIYWPAHIFATQSWSVLLQGITVQLVWILLFIGIARALFKRGTRKVQIHGG